MAPLVFLFDHLVSERIEAGALVPIQQAMMRITFSRRDFAFVRKAAGASSGRLRRNALTDVSHTATLLGLWIDFPIFYYCANIRRERGKRVLSKLYDLNKQVEAARTGDHVGTWHLGEEAGSWTRCLSCQDRHAAIYGKLFN